MVELNPRSRIGVAVLASRGYSNSTLILTIYSKWISKFRKMWSLIYTTHYFLTLPQNEISWGPKTQGNHENRQGNQSWWTALNERSSRIVRKGNSIPLGVSHHKWFPWGFSHQENEDEIKIFRSSRKYDNPKDIYIFSWLLMTPNDICWWTPKDI